MLLPTLLWIFGFFRIINFVTMLKCFEVLKYLL